MGALPPPRYVENEAITEAELVQAERIFTFTHDELETWGQHVAQAAVTAAIDYKTADWVVENRQAARTAYEQGYQAGVAAGSALPRRKVVERGEDGRIVAMREEVVIEG
jgi:hypothetical protein